VNLHRGCALQKMVVSSRRVGAEGHLCDGDESDDGVLDGVMAGTAQLM